jgi:hypothetical protein
MVMNPKALVCAMASGVTPAAGCTENGNGSGSCASRLSPPMPATNVGGCGVEKSMAWKSCTCPWNATPMPGG